MLSKCLTALIALIFGLLCTGQNSIVRPARALDIRALIRSATGRTDFVVGDIAQNHGRWAAVINYATNESMLVTGGDSDAPQVSPLISGGIERIALSNGKMYLRYRSKIAATSDIEVRDETFKPLARRSVQASVKLEPVASSSGVYWIDGAMGETVYGETIISPGPRIPAGKLQFSHAAGAIFSTETPDPDHKITEFRKVFAADTPGSGTRWIEVSELSEEVAVFEQNGRLVARQRLLLDAAYVAADQHAPRRNLLGGTDRIMWSAVSHDGLLYVCLSGVSIGQPRPIAVFNPETGKLMRVFQIVTPTIPERQNQYNLEGFVWPISGVLDDRMVIADNQFGILGIYSNYERTK